MSGLRGERLQLILFIEGVQVPVIAATVTHAAHAASTAYIQVLGTDAAEDLKPHSIIEAYVYNPEQRSLADVKSLPFYRYENEKVVRGFSNAGISTGDLFSSAFNDSGARVSVEELQADLQYDLLFFGELIGYSFYEDAQSRTVNLMCSDMSAHLDRILQYTIDANQAVNMAGLAKQALLSGVLNTGSGPILQYDSNGNYAPIQAIESGVKKGGDGVSSLNINVIAGGTIGIEQQLLQYITSLGLQLTTKAMFGLASGAYAYFKEMDDEFNIRDSIVVVDDPAIARLFAKQSLTQYVFGILNSIGSMNSLRNLLKVIYQSVHYEFCPVPGNPFYFARDYDKAHNSTVASQTSSSYQALTKLLTSMKTTMLKPELAFAEPPACNVIFPDEMYSINVSRHFGSEPTRGIDSTGHVFADEEQGTNVGTVTNTYTISPSVFVPADRVDISYAPGRMVDMANEMSGSLRTFSKYTLGEEIYKGILAVHNRADHWLRSAYLSRSDALDNPLNTTGITRDNAADELSVQDRRFFMQDSNYRFVHTRYQSRSAQVSCKFLPRLMPGFSMLACDKFARNEQELKETSYFGHLGHAVQITHFVSQGGGVTSVQLSHVRKTDEKIDVFTQSVAREITPDFRLMGVAPWLTFNSDGTLGNMHPEKIKNAYAQWLGGMTWQGDEIDSPSLAVSSGYLGVLPLTWALAQTPVARTTYGIPGVDNQNGVPKTTSVDTNIRLNFLNILREMMLSYIRNVGTDGAGSVEDFYADLGRRPVANRLQMRGYLNAYQTQAKGKFTFQQGNASFNAAIQAFLASQNLYKGTIDGSFGNNSKAALKEYQTREGLTDTGGVLDDATVSQIRNTVAENPGLALEGPFELAIKFGTSATAHQSTRRTLRLAATTRYLESLSSLGRGLRG